MFGKASAVRITLGEKNVIIWWFLASISISLAVFNLFVDTWQGSPVNVI